MIQIAVIGHGVVGSGVVDLLHENKAGISSRAHETIRVKYILDLRDFPELPYASKFIKDFATIENDDEVRIVVECIGGVKIAYDYVKRSLLAGKSVVTSNKELVAAHGQELLELAQERNLNFLFEASVGGGIPIIRPLSQCLAANEVTEIAGILNGTTNFILTKMIYDKMSFDDALALAQKLGYAERDPSADVDGHDSCRKICILASLAFGHHVYPEQVSTEGIRNVTLEDVSYADVWGGSIKLLGVVKPCGDGKLDMCVAPMLIPKTNQLWRVDDVFNGILACGNATGDVLFYGRGAGKMPTASAVVADVIDCTKHFNARKYLYWDKGSPDLVIDASKSVFPMYIRATGLPADELTAAVEKVYGSCQKLTREGVDDEVAFIVPAAPYGEQCSKRQQLEWCGVKVLGFMRVFAD
ncbi:MAG: homoserine dehydrogenase [Ruminococcaceae bacterium]|nr:homoserine dehydrogenase [Oscillospiraceae bacterium]